MHLLLHRSSTKFNRTPTRPPSKLKATENHVDRDLSHLRRTPPGNCFPISSKYRSNDDWNLTSSLATTEKPMHEQQAPSEPRECKLSNVQEMFHPLKSVHPQPRRLIAWSRMNPISANRIKNLSISRRTTLSPSHSLSFGTRGVSSNLSQEEQKARLERTKRELIKEFGIPRKPLPPPSIPENTKIQSPSSEMVTLLLALIALALYYLYRKWV